MAETFRSGLEAVEPIQMESALSLGMTRQQAVLHVILPQAVSISVPAFVANVIFLLKETSVFSAISLMDLMFTAKDLIGLYYKTLECLTLLLFFLPDHSASGLRTRRFLGKEASVCRLWGLMCSLTYDGKNFPIL